MFDTIKRSMDISKISFKILIQNKNFLIFPFLGGFFSIIFMFLLFFPTIIVSILNSSGESIGFGILEFVLIFLWYFIAAFMATFFNVCTVYTVKKKFDGEKTSIKEAIEFSFSRINLIIYWSILSATVGLILKALSNSKRNTQGFRRVILSMVIKTIGFSWSLASTFVVPCIVYYNIGPIDSLKKSVDIIKGTWGESVSRHIGFGLLKGILSIIGILVFFALFFISLDSNFLLAILFLFLGMLYLVLINLIFVSMEAIYNTTLFVYAQKKEIKCDINRELLDRAFY